MCVCVCVCVCVGWRERDRERERYADLYPQTHTSLVHPFVAMCAANTELSGRTEWKVVLCVEGSMAGDR